MINSIAIFFILVTDLLLYCFSIFRRPEWSEKIKWSKINLYSLFLTIASVTPLIFYIKIGNSIVYTISLVSFTIVLYNFFQSLWSDVKLRLVDRKLQYLSILFLIAFNLFTLIFYHMGATLNFYVIFILFFSIFVLTPKLMGASDARALVIGVAGLYPMIGIYNFFNVFKVLFAIILFYSFGLFIIASSRQKKLAWSIFKSRINIPAVPLILLSFIITGIFYIV